MLTRQRHRLVLRIFVSTAMICAAIYVYSLLGYVTARFTARKLGITNVKAIPCAEMPVVAMPTPMTEYQDGVVGVRVPSTFALVSTMNSVSNKFPMRFSDGERSLRVSTPEEKVDFETICSHVNHRLTGRIHVSHTGILEMAFPIDTPESRKRKTFPSFVQACYKCDFHDMHWSMSEKDLTRHLVLLTASTLFRGDGGGTAEFVSSSEYDGILHWDGTSGVFTWEAIRTHQSGYIHFVSNDSVDDLGWVRAVCQGIYFP